VLTAALSVLALGGIGSVAQADTFTLRIATGRISSSRIQRCATKRTMNADI